MAVDNKHFRVKNGLKVGDVEVISASGTITASKIYNNAGQSLSATQLAVDTNLESLSASLGTYVDSSSIHNLIVTLKENASSQQASVLASKHSASSNAVSVSSSKSAADLARIDAQSYRDNALSSQHSASGYALSASGKLTTIEGYEDSASGHKLSISASKLATENEKETASGLRVTASGHATSAESAKESASGHKLSASSTKTTIDQTKSAAQLAKESASGHKISASASRTDTDQSKSAAQLAKETASGHRLTASSDAGLATTYRESASASKSAASLYAGNATDFAGTASGYSLTAAGYAGAALASASSACAAKLSASSYAQSALNAQYSASGYAVSASASKTSAVNAKESASGAKLTASSYATSALNAQYSASGYAVSASNAKGSAVTAKETASGHKLSASSYATSALNAQYSASGYSLSASASKAAAVTSSETASGHKLSASSYATSALNAQHSASGYKLSASASQQAAINSKLSASGHALSASSYATSALNAQHSASGYKISASASKAAAVTSSETASGHKLSASSYATSALNAQHSASGYKVSASGSVTSAVEAKESASGHKLSASSYATSALNAQHSASGYKISASATKTSAVTAKETASGHKVSASSYATSALNAQHSASGYKISASASKAAAVTSSETASGHKLSASSYATSALNAQHSASGYKISASASKESAISSKESASGHKLSASSYATSALNAQHSASGYKIDASSSKTSAVSAKESASGHKLTASSYATSALNAQHSASGYKVSASGSKTSAVEAKETASGHKLTASSYATSALNAQHSASGYSISASASKASAVTSKESASGHSLTASSYATSALNAQHSASGYKISASASKTSAVNAKESASGHSLTASSYATSALNAQQSASSYSISASASKTSAVTAKESASGHKLTASSYATSALNAQYSASGYKISASASKESAISSKESASGHSLTASSYATSALNAQHSASGYKISASASKTSAISSKESASGHSLTASSYATSALNAQYSASGYKISASASKAAAVTSKESASGHKLTASSYATSALNAQQSASGYKISASASKQSAIESKESASGHKLTASSYATSALNAQHSASGYKISASASKTSAISSKESASGHSLTASSYATSALNAQHSASGYKISASASKTSAIGSKESASGHKLTASSYATSALNAQHSASGYSISASASKASAVTAKETASGHKLTASSYATSALNAQHSASGYSISASASKTSAIAAKESASGHKLSASSYATSALNAQHTASGYKISASASKASAVTAKETASGHNLSASSYATSALNAQHSASGYKISASASKTSAISAKESASGASLTASSYATSALNAQHSASGYKISASASKASAVTAKETASGHKLSASSYATSALNAQHSASGYSISASASKTSAISAKETASGHKLSASSYATSALNAQQSASGYSLSASASKGSAITAKETASGHKLSASSYATSALNAQHTASGHKLSASSSKASAVTSAQTASGHALTAANFATSSVNLAESASGFKLSASASNTIAIAAESSASSAAFNAGIHETNALEAKETASGYMITSSALAGTAISFADTVSGKVVAINLHEQTAEAAADSLGGLASNVQDIRAIEASLVTGADGHYTNNSWYLRDLKDAKVTAFEDDALILADEYRPNNLLIDPISRMSVCSGTLSKYYYDGYTQNGVQTYSQDDQRVKVTRNTGTGGIYWSRDVGISVEAGVSYDVEIEISGINGNDGPTADSPLNTLVVYVMAGTASFEQNPQASSDQLSYTELADICGKQVFKATFTPTVSTIYLNFAVMSYDNGNQQLTSLCFDNVAIHKTGTSAWGSSKYATRTIKDGTEAFAIYDIDDQLDTNHEDYAVSTTGNFNEDTYFYRVYSTSPIAVTSRAMMATPSNFAGHVIGYKGNRDWDHKVDLISPFGPATVKVYSDNYGTFLEGITGHVDTIELKTNEPYSWDTSALRDTWAGFDPDTDTSSYIVFVADSRIVGFTRGRSGTSGDAATDQTPIPMLTNSEVLSTNRASNIVKYITGGGISIEALRQAIDLQAPGGSALAGQNDGATQLANLLVGQKPLQNYPWENLVDNSNSGYHEASFEALGFYKNGDSNKVTLDSYNRIRELVLYLNGYYDDLKDVTFTNGGETFTLFPYEPLNSFELTHVNGSNGQVSSTTEGGITARYTTAVDFRTQYAVRAIGDGSGTDAEIGIPRASLSDYYVFPREDITNVQLVAVEPVSVKILEKDGDVLATWESPLDASETKPASFCLGDKDGAGADLGNNAVGPYRIIGTAPFYCICQSTSDDEYTMLGARRSKLASEASLTATATQAVSIKSQVNTLQTTVSQEAQSIDGLQGQYTVKIDNNNHISGFGLASTLTNGQVESAFVIRADRFAIVDPSLDSDNLITSPGNELRPFEINSEGETIIRSAFVKDLSAENIRSGGITGDLISATTRIEVFNTDEEDGSIIEDSYIALDGSDEFYRLYAGHSDPVQAPFSIQKAGEVRASRIRLYGPEGIYFDSTQGLGAVALGEIREYLRRGLILSSVSTIRVIDSSHTDDHTIVLTDNGSNLWQSYNYALEDVHSSYVEEYFNKEEYHIKLPLGSIGTSGGNNTVGYSDMIGVRSVYANGVRTNTWDVTIDRTLRDGEYLQLEWDDDTMPAGSTITTNARIVDAETEQALNGTSIGTGSAYSKYIRLLVKKNNLATMSVVITKANGGTITVNFLTYGAGGTDGAPDHNPLYQNPIPENMMPNKIYIKPMRKAPGENDYSPIYDSGNNSGTEFNDAGEFVLTGEFNFSDEDKDDYTKYQISNVDTGSGYGSIWASYRVQKSSPYGSRNGALHEDGLAHIWGDTKQHNLDKGIYEYRVDIKFQRDSGPKQSPFEWQNSYYFGTYRSTLPTTVQVETDVTLFDAISGTDATPPVDRVIIRKYQSSDTTGARVDTRMENGIRASADAYGFATEGNSFTQMLHLSGVDDNEVSGLWGDHPHPNNQIMFLGAVSNDDHNSYTGAKDNLFVIALTEYDNSADTDVYPDKMVWTKKLHLTADGKMYVGNNVTGTEENNWQASENDRVITADLCWPVGSIYTTKDDNFDPNDSTNIFPGTWAKLPGGKFPIISKAGVGAYNNGGDTGGSTQVTIGYNNINHRHITGTHNYWNNDDHYKITLASQPPTYDMISTSSRGFKYTTSSADWMANYPEAYGNFDRDIPNVQISHLRWTAGEGGRIHQTDQGLNKGHFEDWAIGSEGPPFPVYQSASSSFTSNSTYAKYDDFGSIMDWRCTLTLGMYDEKFMDPQNDPLNLPLPPYIALHYWERTA